MVMKVEERRCLLSASNYIEKNVQLHKNLFSFILFPRQHITFGENFSVLCISNHAYQSKHFILIGCIRQFYLEFGTELGNRMQ